MNIIIYTTPETLSHKRDKGKYDCYWYLRNSPKHTKEGERIYFATKGFIRGYFEIDEIEDEIYFQPETWVGIKPIPTKQFQGFKYFKQNFKPKKEG